MQSIHERRKALTAGIDRDVGNFSIERIAHFVQLTEPCTRIRGLQKRAILVVPRSIEQVFYAGPEIYHRASGPKPFSILLCQHCTAAGSGREGRWAGSAKTECGLHLAPVETA